MRWEPSLRRLALADGATCFLYSAASPDSLRGPEHHLAWCDEFAKWRHARGGVGQYAGSGCGSASGRARWSPRLRGRSRR